MGAICWGTGGTCPQHFFTPEGQTMFCPPPYFFDRSNLGATWSGRHWAKNIETHKFWHCADWNLWIVPFTFRDPWLLLSHELLSLCSLMYHRLIGIQNIEWQCLLVHTPLLRVSGASAGRDYNKLTTPDHVTSHSALCSSLFPLCRCAIWMFVQWPLVLAESWFLGQSKLNCRLGFNFKIIIVINNNKYFIQSCWHEIWHI